MSSCSTSTTIAGIFLPCCVYNASGPRTQSIEALQKIGDSQAGCILSKSTTLEKQMGNSLPRAIQKIDLGSSYCEGSINSEGLPNEGIDYCKFTFHLWLQHSYILYLLVSLDFSFFSTCSHF